MPQTYFYYNHFIHRTDRYKTYTHNLYNLTLLDCIHFPSREIIPHEQFHFVSWNLVAWEDCVCGNKRCINVRAKAFIPSSQKTKNDRWPHARDVKSQCSRNLLHIIMLLPTTWTLVSYILIEEDWSFLRELSCERVCTHFFLSTGLLSQIM